MTYDRFSAALLSLSFWLFATVPSVCAQVETDLPAPPTIEGVEALVRSLPENDPEVQTYKLAIDALNRAATAKRQAAELAKQKANAPGQLTDAKEELNSPRPPVEIAFHPAFTRAELEAAQAQAIASLQVAKDKMAELAMETKRREGRRKEIPELLAVKRQQLADASAELRAGGSLDSQANLYDPKSVLARSLIAEMMAEISALEAELANYDARRELLSARRDLAERHVNELEQRVAAWQEAVEQAREREARLAAAEAERLRRDMVNQNAVVRAYAAENAALAKKLDPDSETPTQARSARERLGGVENQLKEISRNEAALFMRLQAANLNQATGRMLRRTYEQLEDFDVLERQINETRRRLEDAEYRHIELRESRDAFGSVEEELARLLDRANVTSQGDEELKATIRELVAARRDLLNALVDDASRNIQFQFALLKAEDELLAASTAYRDFISERILWIRSLPANRGARLSDLKEFASWISQSETWMSTWEITRRWMMERFVQVAVFLALIVLASIAARIGARRQARIAELTRHPATDSLSLTFKSLGWTVIMSTPVALTLYSIGFVVRCPPGQTVLGLSVAKAFLGAGVVWFSFAFLRNLAANSGLAEAHFKWPPAATSRIRTETRWAGVALSLGVAVMAVTDAAGLEAATATPGRLGFTMATLAAAVFIFRLMRPRGLVMGIFPADGQDDWLNRARQLWLWALVAAPIVFLCLAWSGYVYTAYLLFWRLGVTFCLLVIVLLGNALLRRWLFVARERVVAEEERRRQAEAADDLKPKVAMGLKIEEEPLDLSAISGQTRQLIRVVSVVAALVGVLAVWGDLLPALRMLERVEIYPRLRVVEARLVYRNPARKPVPMVAPDPRPAEPADTSVSTRDAANPAGVAAATGVAQKPFAPLPHDGSASSPQSHDIETITLLDIALALVILLSTMVAFRNVPGLAEIFMLRRLPLDAGSRYAITTLLRYAIAIIGTFAAFSHIGMSWSKVQWLAAAFTFGLAFGLQEIFANFISGLIILAERPIRIGDTVTIQNVTGTVLRIRMRATTITDWDRKELIIPNKSFITGEVINWSLSDSILRLTLSVGISYDSDIHKAERLLLAAAERQANVLPDPKPHVNFTRFGESSLDFELRVFIPSIEHMFAVRHELHMRITEDFRAAGIEIAFPQRDIHLRSISDLARNSIVKKSRIHGCAEEG